MRRVVICADDYGLDAAVDAGVLRLAEDGRVTAASCLAGAPGFAARAGALLATGADAGLHLDLTDGTDGAPVAGLGGLLARAHLGLLDRGEVRRRLAQQLDAFERIAGRPPAFVDGHRHVHQLPGVAPLLLEALVRRYPGRPPAVRSTWPRRWRGAKAAVIAALGAGPATRALAAAGVPVNRDFGGVYGLDAGAPYRDLMRGWLGSIEDLGLLMCHPGEAGPVPHAEARVAELAYLASPAFEADCLAAGVVRVGVAALRAGAA